MSIDGNLVAGKYVVSLELRTDFPVILSVVNGPDDFVLK